MSFVNKEKEAKFQESLDQRRKQLCMIVTIFYIIPVVLRILLNLKDLLEPLIAIQAAVRVLAIVGMIIASFTKNDLLSGQKRSTIVISIIFINALFINLYEEYLNLIDSAVVLFGGKLVYWSVVFPILMVVFCSGNQMQCSICSISCFIIYKNLWYLHIRYDDEEVTALEAHLEIAQYIAIYLTATLSLIQLCNFGLRIAFQYQSRIEEAEAALMKDKFQFIVNVNHDTGSLYQVLQGVMEEVSKLVVTCPDLGPLLRTMRSCMTLLSLSRNRAMNCARMNNVDFAKPVFAVVNLVSMFQELSDVISGHMTRRNVRFVFRIEKHLTEVNVVSDLGWLMDNLLNFIGNASKYTIEGEIVVSAYTVHNRKGIRFDVTDSGSGVSDKHKGLLFTAFTRVEDIEEADELTRQRSVRSSITKNIKRLISRSSSVLPFSIGDIAEGDIEAPECLSPSSKHISIARPAATGTGRGLSEIKKKVDSVGGYVGIEDVDPHGSDFFFVNPLLISEGDDGDIPANVIEASKTWLPRDMLNEKGVYLPQHDPAGLDHIEWATGLSSMDVSGTGTAMESSSASNRNRILVVDDVASVRRMWIKFLTKENYDVDECEDGDKALKLMKKKLYKLVLMDMQMPGLDGLLTLRRIRQWEREMGKTDKNRQIIAIMSMSAGKDNHLEKLLNDAHVDYIGTKPCDKAKVLSELLTIRRNLKGEEEFKLP